jgi:hypothetical protein
MVITIHKYWLLVVLLKKNVVYRDISTVYVDKHEVRVFIFPFKMYVVYRQCTVISTLMSALTINHFSLFSFKISSEKFKNPLTFR